MSQHKNISTFKKRDDIQGLRGLAIAAVLFFHLHPSVFINGFLGVDVFFVLSGYLMSSILSREAAIMSCQTISAFYLRRFKRIVPLYAIALLAVSVVTPFVLIPVDTRVYTEDAYWALAFATNMKDIIRRADYWRGVYKYPLLLHTWSLGVEIQYYLFAPFIVAACRNFRRARNRLAFLSIFSLASLAMHISSRKSISFGFLLARTWQFWAGACCYEAQSVHKWSTKKERLLEGARVEKGGRGNCCISVETMISSRPLVSLISLILILFVPFPTLNTVQLRILSTILTGIILFYGHFQENFVLSFKPLAYLGDLSYVTYLVHWPFIVFTKYQLDLSQLNISNSIPCLAIILLLSLLIHEKLEKFLLRASNMFSLIIVLVVYGLVLCLLLTGALQSISEREIRADYTKDFPIYSTELVNEAIRFNTEAPEEMKARNVEGMKLDMRLIKWANYTPEGAAKGRFFPQIIKAKGKTRILVVGNSYSFKALQMIASIFAGRYRELRNMAFAGCKFISVADCGDFRAASMRVIGRMRPDLVFIVSRDMDMVREKITGSLANDTMFQQLDEYIKFAANHSGLVVLQTQHYNPPGDVASKIVKRLRQGNFNWTDLSITFKHYQAAYRNEIRRIDGLDYPNLIVLRAQEQLCNDMNGTCWFYNSRNLHSYYADDAAHLSREGLIRQFPAYSATIEYFLRQFDPSSAQSPSKDYFNRFPFIDNRGANKTNI